MKCSLSHLKINTIQNDDDKRMNFLQNLSISSTNKSDDEFRMNSLNKSNEIANSTVNQISDEFGMNSSNKSAKSSTNQNQDGF